jgi:DNA-binding MarR family transcriptional regulator
MMGTVGEALQRRLRQARFDSPAQEAMLNLLVAAGHVRDEVGRAYGPFGITPQQYNVLRILRGVHPGGYARCEIALRMIDRAPDLTRLVDRLAQRGCVERLRSSADRRHSVTRITRRGLDVLERMQPAVEGLHRAISARLSRVECEALSGLLEQLYGGAEPPVDAGDDTGAARRTPVARPRRVRHPRTARAASP